MNPDKECSGWSEALRQAQKIAGCDKDKDECALNKCQQRIWFCSKGCDIWRNLKPGSGASTSFGIVQRLGSTGIDHERTGPRGLFGGYDTRFDVKNACGDIHLLAQVMIHEAVHACPLAGGANGVWDPGDFGAPVPVDSSCYANLIAPFNSEAECGETVNQSP
jgi:hypothetical protein